ncbi:MAG: signal recognition particle protein, partial [Pseudolabrys sp.]|nr:signal recognition particle protein [Pseudolabrys sp.]
RGMADMMKMMGSGKRGPLAGLANMMGMGGGAPSPEQMAELAKKAKAGGMDMPNLPPTLPPNFPGAQGGLPGGLPNLPGLGGGKLPGLPGGFHGLGKKK